MNNIETPAGETLLAAVQSASALLPQKQPAAARLEDLEAGAETAFQAFRLAATPTSTWQTYARGLRYVCGWAQARFGEPLPVPTPPAVATQFVVDHFGLPVRDKAGRLTLTPVLPAALDQALVDSGFKSRLGPLKMSTIDHRLAILSWAHHEKNLVSPTEDPAVRRLLADCRKLALELGQAPKPKAAAPQDALDAMLATCDESLEGLRDRAVLLFGWSSGGRRRSEIANALVEDLEWLDERTAVFSMRQSKTGDTGPKPVVEDAAAALRAWLDRAGIRTGPLFRRLYRGGATLGGGLTPHSIGQIVKSRAELAGLVGDFAGHSLRRGFVTEAGANQLPLADTMAMTGHRTVKSVVRYGDAGALARSPAARLLAAGRKRRSPPDVG
ncbi:Phage integrase family protein [Solimonas aquatica]|uniref:Phage integrase family protein n=1 Tax=Solimonas aquatica TaxID=489703 RepID=A0A1H9A6J5_9GAMM|nr:site-specific integrase [Solimonas aquatica]SEP72103.1 Phage integrase family protein [Solimonas aquatica]